MIITMSLVVIITIRIIMINHGLHDSRVENVGVRSELWGDWGVELGVRSVECRV